MEGTIYETVSSQSKILKRFGEENFYKFIFENTFLISQGLRRSKFKGTPVQQTILKILSVLENSSNKQKEGYKQEIIKLFNQQNNLLFFTPYPMTIYFETFKTKIEIMLEKYNVSNEIKRKSFEILCLLRKFDLRRLATGEKFYEKLCDNIINSLVSNQPIQFIQFACTKRKVGSDSFLIDTSVEGNSVCGNAPYLKVMSDELNKLGVDNIIDIIFADSENIWVDTMTNDMNNIDDKLSSQRKEASNNLQDFFDETVGENKIRVLQASIIEKTMKEQYRWDMQKLFNEQKSSIYKLFPKSLMIKMSYVRKAVEEGNQRNAFTIAEDECEKNLPNLSSLNLEEIKKVIGTKFVEKSMYQLAEYALQGQMLELMNPNAILLQNEKPADVKNSFYQPLRKDLLPEINPYSYT